MTRCLTAAVLAAALLAVAGVALGYRRGREMAEPEDVLPPDPYLAGLLGAIDVRLRTMLSDRPDDPSPLTGSGTADSTPLGPCAVCGHDRRRWHTFEGGWHTVDGACIAPSFGSVCQCSGFVSIPLCGAASGPPDTDLLACALIGGHRGRHSSRWGEW